MLFLLGKDRKTEHNTHFCMPLEPVFTRCCGSGVHFMDEPTNALDESGVEEIRQVILEEKERGALILLASHNKDDIRILADELYRVENGQVMRQEESV